MKIVVIVQARLSSSRLPAKTVLTIAGYPIVSVIAQRIACDDYDVVFAVPEGDEGDILEKQLISTNTKIVRGSLNNVLERFYKAIEPYQNDDIIIRLTADNLLPDKYFLQELIEKYDGKSYGHTEINQHIYGASAEIFLVKHLRDAYENTRNSHDCEHVTPYIRNKYPNIPIKHDFQPVHSLRLTLDNYSDYVNLSSLFETVKDNYLLEWKKLARVAGNIFPAPNKLMIGTVQFGIDYGIANKTGQLSTIEQEKIFEFLSHFPTITLDTATDYGEAESILGQYSHSLSNAEIITKLSHKPDTPLAVENNIYCSLRKLKRNKLDGVLLHKFAHYGTELWDSLMNLKLEGLITKIGVSIYDIEEANILLGDKNIDIIQFPFNILDWRWKDFIDNPNNDKELHIRSVYLQGAILHQNILEDKGYSHISQELELLRLKYNKESLADLALSYVRSFPRLDKIILGVDSFEQLQENYHLFKNEIFSTEEREEIYKIFSSTPNHLIDIRKW